MKKNINHKFLIVNPENYRFDPVDNQEQAIDLMLEEKGLEIFHLAKHILENGLDQAKDFRVRELSKDKYLVLDGNRRTTALKCLNDISIIKDKSLKLKFNKLDINKDKIPKDAQCFVYSSENDASKWIKLDHTGKNKGVGQDSWGSTEIGRFGYKFEGIMSPALQAVDIVEKAMGVSFDTQKLKITTIERILSNPESRSFLGIDIKNKKIIFIAKKKEAIDRLNILFSKIIKDKVKVSTVYKKDKTIDFMTKLFIDKPEPKNEQKGLFSTEDEVPPSAEDNPSNNTKKSRTEDSSSNKPDTLAKKDWITDKEYKSYDGADKVKFLLKEMKLLDPKNNAHILMPALRVLLELSLYYQLEKKGYIKKIVINYKENIKKDNTKRIKKKAAIIQAKKNWSPSFREMLSYIANEKNSVIDDPQARDTLNKIIKNKKNENFVANLNEFIHNVYNIPAKGDPEEVWRKFGRLLFSVIEKIK